MFKANGTSTVDLPAWAPDIRYASTGEDSHNVVITFATTTSKHPNDWGLTQEVYIVSHTAREMVLSKKTLATKPYITMTYESVGELVRT